MLGFQKWITNISLAIKITRLETIRTMLKNTFLWHISPMKTWNIGNTTVRNPLRIEDGLKVLDEKIAGREWTTSKEYQGAMWQELAEHKVIDSESTKERESLG